MKAGENQMKLLQIQTICDISHNYSTSCIDICEFTSVHTRLSLTDDDIFSRWSTGILFLLAFTNF